MPKVKARCDSCRKKINALMLSIHKCRCGGTYCGAHLHDHSCTFDYKKDFVDASAEKMPKIESVKVAPI